MAEAIPATSKADIDPNDWDQKESIFEFIHREFARLSPKIPDEFGATGFRISFIATTDKREYPIDAHFSVAMCVLQVGEVRMPGRNPTNATMKLIDWVYKEYAKIIQQEDAARRRERAHRDADARESAAYQSLLEYTPQEIADMIDGDRLPPDDVTPRMILERSRKIAVETVRELTDPELEQANPPSFLSEDEHEGFKVRCASELRCRTRVREIYEENTSLWQGTKDAYAMLLRIWRLCSRQAGVLEDVIVDYFYADAPATGSRRTLDTLLPIAPQAIKKARRDKAVARAEADRPAREARESEYRRNRDEYQALQTRSEHAYSKTRVPY